MATGIDRVFLEELLRDVKGISKASARRLVEAYPSLVHVLKDSEEVVKQKVGQLSLRRVRDIRRFLTGRVGLDPDLPDAENTERLRQYLIRRELRAIAEKKYELLGSIKFEELSFNPFLLRLLGLKTPNEIAEFMVAERVERSLVTSYGTHIQRIAQIVAGRGTGVEGADVCKEEGGRRYYIQVKAGPYTVNKDISKQVSDLLTSATRRNSGSAALLGMTYGSKEKVSSIVRRYSRVDWLVGREFWGFISGDPDYASKLFKLAAEVAAEVQREKGPFPIREKVREIAGRIREEYGKGRQMWEKLFDDNM
ncbi:PmeII family type II restriction endonuclease [Ammonifex thiophilus]|uniref:PmeII family type II restriction endonuclease n=1 Tax=Ammonifex thiophilus TaxID=444093 RepID=UPI001401CBBA|nr:PmeII family type II restriction endonuclease [Ammonifex thiophilus]